MKDAMGQKERSLAEVIGHQSVLRRSDSCDWIGIARWASWQSLPRQHDCLLHWKSYDSYILPLPNYPEPKIHKCLIIRRCEIHADNTKKKSYGLGACRWISTPEVLFKALGLIMEYLQAQESTARYINPSINAKHAMRLVKVLEK